MCRWVGADSFSILPVPPPLAASSSCSWTLRPSPLPFVADKTCLTSSNLSSTCPCERGKFHLTLTSAATSPFLCEASRIRRCGRRAEDQKIAAAAAAERMTLLSWLARFRFSQCGTDQNMMNWQRNPRQASTCGPFFLPLLWPFVADCRIGIS